MVSEPEKVSSEQGTKITVKDLFYNLPIRKKAVNVNEEWKHIQNLIFSLALHHFKVKFKLTKD